MKIGIFYTPEPFDSIAVECEKSVFCDVDETLTFMNPTEGCQPYAFSKFGHMRTLYLHTHHIDKLREFKTRGHAVFVWSQGGVSWAKAIVEACGLLGVVHVIPKPDWIIDDKDSSKWMPQRFFLDPVTGKDTSGNIFSTPNEGER